jgi:membrane protein
MFGKKKKDQGEKDGIVKILLNLFKLITGEQLISDRAYGRMRKRLIRTVQVGFSSATKFMEDDCLTKASSIAYTVIVSLIPTLAVGLTFFSVFGVGHQKEELFVKITKFMAENNLSRLNIDPYLETLSSIIDNAAGIGGVGAIVLIFSATAVLRTLEHSLNTVWNVKKERGWVAKTIYYWAALTLGPIMLIAGTTLAAQVSTVITRPNYHAIAAGQENRIWVAGNKATIRYTDHDFKTFTKIQNDSIDFDNQVCMTYDPAANTFGEDEYRFDDMDFAKSDFSDITFVGQRGWAVGKNGIILHTDNAGSTWRLSKWGSFSFNMIAMTDRENGVIVADRGYMLRTTNGGFSWEVTTWPDITGSIRSVAVSGKTGIAVSDKGYIIRSTDGGKTWTPQRLEKLKSKKRYTNLNSVSLADEKHGWIAADDGIVVTTDDGFATYDVKHFRENKYTAALLIGPNEGYIGGEHGILLYSRDNASTWKKSVLHRGTVNRLVRAGNVLWSAGDSGHLMASESFGKWKGEKGTGFIIYLINFMGPFIFVWLTFLLLYKLLPNTKVPLKPAAIGASITGAIWVAFILGFIVYVKSFASGTFAIYGALAAFPIFLLMVYTSAAIILYGAEVSYMIVHVESYLRKKRMSKFSHDLSIYAGLRILHHVFSKFEKGKGETAPAEIAKLCDKPEEMTHFLTLFTENNLLKNVDGSYIPATSSATVRMEAIINLANDFTFEIPSSAPDDLLKKKIGKLFNEMSDSNRKITGDLTLSDVIKS